MNKRLWMDFCDESGLESLLDIVEKALLSAPEEVTRTIEKALETELKGIEDDFFRVLGPKALFAYKESVYPEIIKDHTTAVLGPSTPVEGGTTECPHFFEEKESENAILQVEKGESEGQEVGCSST